MLCCYVCVRFLLLMVRIISPTIRSAFTCIHEFYTMLLALCSFCCPSFSEGAISLSKFRCRLIHLHDVSWPLRSGSLVVLLQYRENLTRRCQSFYFKKILSHNIWWCLKNINKMYRLIRILYHISKLCRHNKRLSIAKKTATKTVSSSKLLQKSRRNLTTLLSHLVVTFWVVMLQLVLFCYCGSDALHVIWHQ